MRNMRFSLLLTVAGFSFCGSTLAICETQPYKVIVGYGSEAMSIPLVPGRVIEINGSMPSPVSPEMENAFPDSPDIPTVVPPKNPPQIPAIIKPVEDIVPMIDVVFPEVINPVPTPEGLKDALDDPGRVVVAGITFDFDSANLTDSSGPSLEAILGYLQKNPGVRIKIEGHCDTSGDTSLNPALSQNRANAVRDWLVNRGIDPSRINSVGMSDNVPIADNSTPEGQAKNRRVELVKE